MDIHRNRSAVGPPLGLGLPAKRVLFDPSFEFTSPDSYKTGTRLEHSQFAVLDSGFKETPSTADLFGDFGEGQELAGHALVNDRCFLTWETTKGETMPL